VAADLLSRAEFLSVLSRLGDDLVCSVQFIRENHEVQ